MARRRKNPKMGDVLIYAGLAGVAFLIYRELNKPKQQPMVAAIVPKHPRLLADPRRLHIDAVRRAGMRVKAPAPPPPPGWRPPPPPPPKS